MKNKLDQAGRLLIPKSIRQQAGFNAEDMITFEVTTDYAIILRKENKQNSAMITSLSNIVNFLKLKTISSTQKMRIQRCINELDRIIKDDDNI